MPTGLYNFGAVLRCNVSKNGAIALLSLDPFFCLETQSGGQQFGSLIVCQDSFKYHRKRAYMSRSVELDRACPERNTTFVVAASAAAQPYRSQAQHSRSDSMHAGCLGERLLVSVS